MPPYWQVQFFCLFCSSSRQAKQVGRWGGGGGEERERSRVKEKTKNGSGGEERGEGDSEVGERDIAGDG